MLVRALVSTGGFIVKNNVYMVEFEEDLNYFIKNEDGEALAYNKLDFGVLPLEESEVK